MCQSRLDPPQWLARSAPWHGRVVLLLLALAAGCRPSLPTPAPPPTATVSLTPTATATASPTSTATPTPTFPADAIASVAALNVRAGPDVLHPVVAAVHAATPMAVRGRDHLGQWFAVRLPDDTHGWVNARLVHLQRRYETIPTLPTPTSPPTPTATPEPMDPALPAIVWPPAVARGDPFLVRVRAAAGARALALLAEIQTELLPAGPDALVGLLPTNLEMPPGEYPVHITLIDEHGEPRPLAVSLTVRDAEYPEQALTFQPEAIALLDAEGLRQESERLAALCNTLTPERLWQGPWRAPVIGSVSSPFGARRTYQDGAAGSLHSGTDVRAAPGTPVLAPAPGRVILAEPLPVRGQAVLLDHGWGVCSGYFHLDTIDVAVGDLRQAGDRLGTVGASGLATGPHLHWEVRVRGVPVQPMQFLLRDVSAVP